MKICNFKNYSFEKCNILAKDQTNGIEKVSFTWQRPEKCVSERKSYSGIFLSPSKRLKEKFWK